MEHKAEWDTKRNETDRDSNRNTKITNERNREGRRETEKYKEK